jgi:hypothetical protein
VEEFWVVKKFCRGNIASSKKHPRFSFNLKQAHSRKMLPVAPFARVDDESYNLKFRQCPIEALCGLSPGYHRSNG